MGGCKRAFFFLSIFLQMHIHASWYDLRAEGWFYFEEDEKKEDKQEKILTFEEIKSKGLSGKEKTELFQRELKSRLNELVWQPTNENIEKYIAFQNNMMKQNSLSTEKVQSFYLNNPELSFEGESPNALHARGIKKLAEETKDEESLREASKVYGLMFFYEGTNPQTSFFSQVLQEFCSEYHFELLPISVDGVFLSGDVFPKSQKDNGISETMRVKHFPSVYMVDGKSGDYFPIANSSLSLNKLEANALLQMKNRGML